MREAQLNIHDAILLQLFCRLNQITHTSLVVVHLSNTDHVAMTLNQ